MGGDLRGDVRVPAAVAVQGILEGRQHGGFTVIVHVVAACRQGATIKVFHGERQWKLIPVEIDDTDPDWKERCVSDAYAGIALVKPDDESESVP